MPEQMFFEDTPAWRGEEEEERKPESTPIFQDDEPVKCQMCQDGGPCSFCERGRLEQIEIISEQKRSGWNLWKQIGKTKKGGKD